MVRTLFREGGGIRGWWLAVGLLLLGSGASAQDGDVRNGSEPPLRKVRNAAFGVGEFLVYTVQVGPIVAGEVRLEVRNVAEVEGRPCYRISSRARSNRLFSAFYRVNDSTESLVDVAGIFPWKFEKHLRQGRYRADQTVAFDQRRRRAIANGDTVAVPKFVQDSLSGLYYVRTMALDVGQEITIDHYNNGKLYPLLVKVHGREVVEVPAGYFRCLVVEPMTRDPGLFKASGTLKAWLTDDGRKMPVQMESKIPVGTIVAKLVNFAPEDTVHSAAWAP
jgi:hypothetical protein